MPGDCKFFGKMSLIFLLVRCHSLSFTLWMDNMINVGFVLANYILREIFDRFDRWNSNRLRVVGVESWCETEKHLQIVCILSTSIENYLPSLKLPSFTNLPCNVVNKGKAPVITHLFSRRSISKRVQSLFLFHSNFSVFDQIQLSNLKSQRKTLTQIESNNWFHFRRASSREHNADYSFEWPALFPSFIPL